MRGSAATARTTLVTGAGGTVGSELCRQLHTYGPEELIMLDRDESALHEVQLSIHGRALLDSPEVVLCDIRDRSALDGGGELVGDELQHPVDPDRAGRGGGHFEVLKIGITGSRIGE